MKIFVTGATGFLGRRLVSKLIERGYQVTCLVREPRPAEGLTRLGAQIAVGDITDRESLRAAMIGVDAVFHVAAWYQVGVKPGQGAQMYAVNVEGTRNTIGLAAELGVAKIIYTSTIAFFGNTQGRVPDENYRAEFGSLTSEYERTKWMAHYEVALPLAQKGAPIIIVQPGPIVGDGDHSGVPLMYQLYLRRFPIMPGKNSGLSWTHVDDVAEGHLLALEKGRIGESYILAGQPLTYREAMQQWAALTGVRAPKLWLPDWFVGATARWMGWLERSGVRISPGAEAVRTLASYTFYGNSAKAQRELGWQPRPIAETFRSVLHAAQKK
jgi:nucleoside-diphosphate-sugar epimerase